MATAQVLRFRLALAALILVLVPLAYWLRFFAPLDPQWRDSTGGAAYVLFWSALVLIVWPKIPAVRAASSVLVATCLLEFLQLWHPGWLEAIRRTLPGRLILGTTFDWADFPSYFAGFLISAVLLRWISANIGIKSVQEDI